MADLFLLIDAVLTEVPVCIGALIDDGDFKTREEAVAYDQAGMDLVWNFTTRAGVTTQTAVTPTTGGGDYDWTNQGNGMYTIGVPATGGASINNDTEGFGWFSGFATGVVPWRGPIVQFSVAQENLELQYDTTGLLGDTFPATQAAVGNLTSGTAAINTTARAAPDGFVITTGLNEGNDEDSTHELDGVVHSLDDDGGTTDAYYIFDVGGNGVPVSITWIGYAQSQNNLWEFYAWNWGLSAWEQVGSILGTAGTTERTETFDLTNAHVGTGADVGLVRFRFASIAGSTLATDRVLCSYAVVAESVGYADGAIWIDSGGTAGAEPFVNGTADNPCPWANAKTLNTALGLDRFHVKESDTLTLDVTVDNWSFLGNHWVLVLDGQSISGAHFSGAEVSGIATGAAAPEFVNCQFGAVTLPPIHAHGCGFGEGDGQFTAGSAGEFTFSGCYSLVAGSGTPDWDFSGLGSTTEINNRAYSGGSNYTLDSDCTISHEVNAGGLQTFTTGGANVELRGIFTGATFVLSGAGLVQVVGVCGPITLSGTATTVVNLYGVSNDLNDTSSGTTVTNQTVSRESVNAEVDQALVDIKLDHLVAVADADDVVDDSIMAKIAASDGDWSGFTGSSDSLEGLSDRLPAALVGGKIDANIGSIDADVEAAFIAGFVAALRSIGDAPGGYGRGGSF